MLAAALVLVADLVVVGVRSGRPHAMDPAVATAAGRSALAEIDTATVAAPEESPAEVPSTTVATTVPPTTTTAPPPPARPTPWTIDPYRGTGVWVDVYDWTNEITGGRPTVGVEHIDQMAAHGIQTIFIQTAHRRSAADVIEPERLLPMIERAHAYGMSVIAWYLPELVDLSVDLRRLLAAAALPVDGVGVDIESRAVGDHAERTRRLIELSQGLRNGVGTKAISAITLDPVHIQVVNPGFWPGFPWPELGSIYDVIVPMAYWSGRKAEWRVGDRYTYENIDRIRASTGRPDMPIHVAGGIANGITLEDLAGMVRAIQERGVMGGSLYDWNTSQPPQWVALGALRAG